MPAIHVTVCAIERYCEQLHTTPDQAIAAMAALRLQQAADFGAPFVRLPTGQRLVIKDHHVVTVLPANHRPVLLHRARAVHAPFGGAGLPFSHQPTGD